MDTLTIDTLIVIGAFLSGERMHRQVNLPGSKLDHHVA